MEALTVIRELHTGKHFLAGVKTGRRVAELVTKQESDGFVTRFEVVMPAVIDPDARISCSME